MALNNAAVDDASGHVTNEIELRGDSAADYETLASGDRPGSHTYGHVDKSSYRKVTFASAKVRTGISEFLDSVRMNAVAIVGVLILSTMTSIIVVAVYHSTTANTEKRGPTAQPIQDGTTSQQIQELHSQIDTLMVQQTNSSLQQETSSNHLNTVEQIQSHTSQQLGTVMKEQATARQQLHTLEQAQVNASRQLKTLEQAQVNTSRQLYTLLQTQINTNICMERLAEAKNTTGCQNKSVMPCASDEVCIDLDKTGTVTGSIPGLTTQASVGATHGMACSRRALFRAQFDKLSNDPSLLCYNGQYTGQQLLRIQMTLTAQRYNHFLDIGDSVSNNGYAGDGGHSDFSAEVNGINGDFNVYANTRDREDDCHAHQIYSYAQVPNSPLVHVTIWIANHFFKFNNNHNVDKSHCNKCLFGLNGQTDRRAGGIADQFIYLGLNRVVQSGSRVGYGLCSVRIKWVDNTNNP